MEESALLGNAIETAVSADVIIHPKCKWKIYCHRCADKVKKTKSTQWLFPMGRSSLSQSTPKITERSESVFVWSTLDCHPHMNTSRWKSHMQVNSCELSLKKIYYKTKKFKKTEIASECNQTLRTHTPAPETRHSHSSKASKRDNATENPPYTYEFRLNEEHFWATIVPGLWHQIVSP